MDITRDTFLEMLRQCIITTDKTSKWANYPAVIDLETRHVTYLAPAMARQLLRDGKVVWISKRGKGVRLVMAETGQVAALEAAGRLMETLKNLIEMMD